jgi:glycosyltransferase involved in cell wall biosynthesis
LHPRKNLRRLIEAFKRFKNTESRLPNMKMIVAGAPMWNEDPALKVLASELKNDLFFMGHVQLHELTQLVGAAHALTYVPYYEGFGIPIVEALKCGIPVIAANKTSLPEVAGDAAIYCDPFDIESICRAMCQLVENQKCYSELACLAIERSNLFSWDKAAEKVWQVLNKK